MILHVRTHMQVVYSSALSLVPSHPYPRLWHFILFIEKY